jgi:putative two-component system response regulator
MANLKEQELEELEELEAVNEAPVRPRAAGARPPAPQGRTVRPAPVRQPALPPAAHTKTLGAPSGRQTTAKPLDGSVISTRLFQTSVFPVIVINKGLRIIYANPASRKFFTGFFKMGSNLFFDVFAKYFTIADVKGIREAVLNGADGSSWRGQAQIKSRDRPTVFTRVYIFPAGINIKNPTAFTVMFDDVTEENRTILRGLFTSLLEASKLKDNDTGKHITRVNYYSEALARELYNRPQYPAVDAEFIDNIGFLAAMHDVGKIGTPDDILNKEGPLSDFEWSVMQEHTKNGAFILEAYPNPMAKQIALAHHEKWNGKGYPFQIEGNMIPLSARIVSIADVYDALRMKRSYKPGFTHEVTMQKMKETRGTQFDPDLLDIMLTMADKFNSIYQANTDID